MTLRLVIGCAMALVLVQIGLGQECRKPRVGADRRVCSHAIIEMWGIVTSELKGQVKDLSSAGVPKSVIEVYESKKNGKLIATYKTGKDGRFCFRNLRRGKYLVKVGWSELGFNCVDAKIQIKGRKKRFVEIMLPVGT